MWKDNERNIKRKKIMNEKKFTFNYFLNLRVGSDFNLQPPSEK
jgi:hypothetical protein